MKSYIHSSISKLPTSIHKDHIASRLVIQKQLSLLLRGFYSLITPCIHYCSADYNNCIVNMEVLKITLVAICLFALAHGYGYKYSFNPYTYETSLYTHLPGQEGPTLFNKFLKSNPAEFSYVDPLGEVKWRCKDQAYYSKFLRKCVWKPSYFKKF